MALYLKLPHLIKILTKMVHIIGTLKTNTQPFPKLEPNFIPCYFRGLCSSRLCMCTHEYIQFEQNGLRNRAYSFLKIGKDIILCTYYCIQTSCTIKTSTQATRVQVSNITRSEIDIKWRGSKNLCIFLLKLYSGQLFLKKTT